MDGNEAASRRIGVTDFRYGSNTCNSWRLSSRMVCASKNVESIFFPFRSVILSSLIIPRPRYSRDYLTRRRKKKKKERKRRRRKSSLAGWSSRNESLIDLANRSRCVRFFDPRSSSGATGRWMLLDHALTRSNLPR